MVESMQFKLLTNLPASLVRCNFIEDLFGFHNLIKIIFIKFNIHASIDFRRLILLHYHQENVIRSNAVEAKIAWQLYLWL